MVSFVVIMSLEKKIVDERVGAIDAKGRFWVAEIDKKVRVSLFLWEVRERLMREIGSCDGTGKYPTKL
jgi:hypothetical protein